MKLRIYPPIVMLIFGLAMFGLAKLLPVGYFDFFGRIPLSKVLIVVVGLIFFFSIFKFNTAKTTVNPIAPEKASKLVTSGIYKYSRNPMYLAMLLLLLAWGLRLGNAFNVLIAAGFVSYINKFQISLEEAALSDKFGKDYRLYCKKVRRWF